MNMKTMSLSALALSLALSQAPAALACNDMQGHHKDWVMKVAEKLDLSTEQKMKVKAIAMKAKMETTAKHKEFKALRMQINEAFRTDSMSQMKVNDFASQEQQIVGAITKIRLQERFDIHNLLTTKQKEKMSMMIAQWEANHEEHEHHHHH